MAISGNTSRYDLLCIFFVLLFADLSEQVPIRSHRSTDAPNCQIWNTFAENCGVCSDGYFGELCELQCRYPNFGKNCQSECFCEKIHCNSTYGCKDDVPSISSSTLPSTNKTTSVLYLTSNKQVSLVPSTTMVNAGSTLKAVTVNVKDCLTTPRPRKRSNEMFYSILGLSVWTVIQFFIYLYLSFCYKSYNW
ncbi:uncharacterized protein LOC144626350 isoform X3 [Crassostrea virginica]